MLFRSAEQFARVLARQLGVTDRHLLPGYEDAWYHSWRERRLPSNVDPLKNNLDDEQERARLEKVFRQGLASVVGWTLPLRRSAAAW